MAGARGGGRIKRDLLGARSKIADFEMTSFMDGPLVSQDLQEVKIETIWFPSTLLFYQIEPLKNVVTLILSSSIARRNSSAPIAKRLFEIL